MKHQQILRRTQAINDTKIQYISVANKIYKVKDIDFHNLTIEATETELSIADVPENEVFPVEEFGEFRVRLCYGLWWEIGDQIKVVPLLVGVKGTILCNKSSYK